MKKTVISHQSSVISKKAWANPAAVLLIFFTFLLMVVPSECNAANADTTIVSETLEYFSKLKKYVAKGSVKVTQEDATIEADEMVYFEETADVTAEGNVRYDDPQSSFTSKSAEMNMDKKTGKLRDANVFFKEDNYHINGSEIERKAENEYYSKDDIDITTCDGPVADWCFRGREMDIVIGQQVTGKDVSFRVNDVPVMYSPYMWMSVNNERKTGFLMPAISSSSARGAGISIPYYWAIAENRDATFVLDSYTKRGIGAGVEYRYIEPRGVWSAWWLYQIHANDLNRNFTELRALHDDRSSGGIGLFLNANIVTQKDYYREVATHREFAKEINPNREKNVQRFLETTAEINVPFNNSRAYLLAQYWIDLKYATGDVPQKLPEVGYVHNYTNLGMFMASADISFTNFWRKNGDSARRIAVNPRILHTMGDDYIFSQMASLRGTAYDYYKDAGNNSNNERLAFEYDASLHTRLIKKYDSFTHVMEPTIRYHYISNAPNDHQYVFDEWELKGKTSRLELSLLNRVIVKGSEMLTARITQPIDMNKGDRPFQPFEIEIGTKKPIPARVSAAYDVNTGKVQSVSSDVKIPFSNGHVSFGQRYNMPANVMVYKAGVEVQPVKPIQAGLEVRYDAKGAGVRNVAAYMQYASQCWGVRLEVEKKPGDFTVQVKFDLFGVTSKPYKDIRDGSSLRM